MAKSLPCNAFSPASQTARHSHGSLSNSCRTQSSASFAVVGLQRGVRRGRAAPLPTSPGGASRAARRCTGSSTLTRASQPACGSDGSIRSRGSWRGSRSVPWRPSGPRRGPRTQPSWRRPAVAVATTSRSTPSICSRSSSAEVKRSFGSVAQAFSSSRYSESCAARAGMSSAGGIRNSYSRLVAGHLGAQHQQRASDGEDVGGDGRAERRHLGRLEADGAVDRGVLVADVADAAEVDQLQGVARPGSRCRA